MNRIWKITAHELIGNLKRRSYLVMVFGVPLLVIAIVGGLVLFRGDAGDETEDPLAEPPDKPAGFVDQSGLFDDSKDFGLFLIRYESEEAALTDVEAGKLAGYYLIPPDYLQAGRVTRYSQQFNLAESNMGVFSAFLLAAMLRDDDPRVLARVQSPAYVIEHQLDRSGDLATEIEGDSFASFGLVYGFSLLMMLTTVVTAGQLTRSVIVEKENCVIEIALSSLRPVQILAGKVLGNGAAGLIHMSAWLGAIGLIVAITGANVPLIGRVELPPTTFAIALVYYVGGYLLFAAFAAGIGAISANLREGPQYAVLYTLPAVAPLIFLASILEAPNGPLALVLSMFPMTAPLGMIERLAISAIPVWQIALSMLLLFGSVAGALWLSARLFRVNTLLSGQLPSRREILQLLLQG